MPDSSRVANGTGLTIIGTALLTLGAVGIAAAASRSSRSDTVAQELGTAGAVTGLVSGGMALAGGVYLLTSPGLSRPGEIPADCHAGLGAGAWLWPVAR